MNTLSELRDFFKEKGLEIKQFNGWMLRVGRDTWTLANDIFYRNEMPQSLKDKEFIQKYTKDTQHVRNQSTDRRSSIKKIMSARIYNN